MKRYLLCALLPAFAVPLHAQEMSGPYLGFALGLLDYEESDDELGVLIGDTSTAYRILGGYRFGDHLAVEGGWGRTSNLEEELSETVFLGTIDLDLSFDYEVATVRVLGLLPLNRVSLFGGAGYYDATLDGKISFALPGLGTTTEDVEGSDDGATIVGGLQIELERLSIRGEFEWFDTDDDIDASMLSIGVLFRF